MARALLVALLLGPVLAGCGGDDEADEPERPPSFTERASAVCADSRERVERLGEPPRLSGRVDWQAGARYASDVQVVLIDEGRRLGPFGKRQPQERWEPVRRAYGRAFVGLKTLFDSWEARDADRVLRTQARVERNLERVEQAIGVEGCPGARPKAPVR